MAIDIPLQIIRGASFIMREVLDNLQIFLMSDVYSSFSGTTKALSFPGTVKFLLEFLN